MEGSDKMAKVTYVFTISKYTVMVLDEAPPLTNYTKYKIDGKLYEPVIVYDAPTSIAVEAFGDFEGKTVEFVRV